MLTVIPHGVRWIDQQWLSQLLSYLVYRLGGLGLLGVVNVGLMAASVGFAVAYARRRGARPWLVMVVLALCLIEIVPGREVRTQAFAIPLLAGTILLLSSDGRRPSSRVLWCLPLLILWANLHGTAAIGAGMVSLYGLTLAWESRRGASATPRWRIAALIVGAPLCLLLTPYGLDIASYYHATMFNSQLKHAVTEWQAITSETVIAIPFFLLAGVVLWSFGRAPRSTTLWEKVVLLVLAAISVMVVRNTLLFGVAALAILPGSLEASIAAPLHRETPIRHGLNNALCWITLSVLAGVAIWTVARPAVAFEHKSEGHGLLTAVRAAEHHDPSLQVFADVTAADWLLWKDPELAGKVAYDARFELLSAPYLVSILRVLGTVGTHWKDGTRGYRLVVLKRSSSDTVRALLAEPGRHVLYEDAGVIAILRPAPAAG
jgi:hypothetical protein